MDVADMIDELTDYGFQDTSVTRKVEYINHSIRDICSREPWPFLEAVVTLNFDGISAIPSNVPSDVRAVMRIMDTVNNRRIYPIRTDDLEDGYVSNINTVTNPLFYYFEGNTLKLAPIPPASTGGYRLRYIRQPALVTSATTSSSILIPEKYHEAIVLGALIRLNDMEDDTELAIRFEQRQEKILDAIKEDAWKKHYDGPDFIHPVTDDNWDYYYCDY